MSSSQTTTRLSLFEYRAPSTLSTKSSTGSTINSSKEEQAYAEYLHKLRMQQYNNVVKTEATFNSGVLGSINTLQDGEMNEVLRSVDSLMSTAVDSIGRNDPVISAPNDNRQQQQQQAEATQPSVLIHGLVATDLLRNGLKSGPLPQQKDSVEQVEVKNPKLGKPNQDLVPTLNSHLNYKQLVGSKNRVVLKYLLVLDLSPKYFEVCPMNKVQPLYSVKMARKPPTWSNVDVDQFTIEIKSPSNAEPGSTPRPHLAKSKSSANLLLPVIRPAGKGSQSHREPAVTSHATHITNTGKANHVPGKRTSRFLNSRSIFDRIYRHFVRVLNFEWLPQADQKNQAQTDRSFDVERRCELSGNQLKTYLKWKVTLSLMI